MFYSLCFNINDMRLMLDVFADIEYSHIFFEELVLGVIPSVPPPLFLVCLFPGLLPGS